MGTRFKYIADDIIDTYVVDLKCPMCHSGDGVFHIGIDDDNGDYWTEACERCIKSMPLRWLSKDDEFTIVSLAQQRFPTKRERYQRFEFVVNSTDEYRRTPWLPNLINGGTWPHCCNDFCEFVGDAGKNHHGPYDTFQWWGHANSISKEDGLKNIASSDRGDSPSLFQCITCEKTFWTHNMT